MFIPKGTLRAARRWTKAGFLYVPSIVGTIALEDEREDDLAAFAHQDVVRAAGGLAVHAFDTDAAGGKCADQLWMDKALPGPRAKDDDIGRRIGDLREMIRGQLVKSARWPDGRCDFRQNDQAMRKAYRIDFDAAIVVGRDSLVMLGGGGMELHDIVDKRMGVNFRQLEEKDGAL